MLTCKPDDEVIPTHSNTEPFVHEPIRQAGKRTAGGVQRRQLPQALHDAERDDTDHAEPDEQRGRTAVGQGAAGSNKQTRADDAGQGHHREMSRLEAALDAAVRVDGGEVALTGGGIGALVDEGARGVGRVDVAILVIEVVFPLWE